MNGRVVVATAVKDLKRRIADPLALVVWMGIPLLVGALMALVSSGSGGAARGVVLLADEEGGLVGQLVEASLGQGPLGALLDVERVTSEEGRTRLARGDASALIVVPPDATPAFLDQRPLALTVVTNPAQRVLPGIVVEALDILVEGAFYVQRVLGAPLRELAGRGSGEDTFPLDQDVARLAADLNVRLRAVRHLLLPPALAVEADQPAGAAGGSPLEGFGRLALPGLVVMSLLFAAQGSSGDIWEEHASGTLRRAAMAPSGLMSVLLGKLVAGTVVGAGMVLVGLLVGLAAFGVPVQRLLMALPWAVFSGAVLIALFTLVQAAAQSQRGANMLTTLLVFPLMMVGGSFFPFESMPPWMAAVGRWTPNGQAVARLKDLLDGRATAGGMLVAALVMLVTAWAALVIAVPRLRRIAAGGA